MESKAKIKKEYFVKEVGTCGMELDELGVLHGDASARGHRIAVA